MSPRSLKYSNIYYTLGSDILKAFLVKLKRIFICNQKSFIKKIMVKFMSKLFS